MKLAQIIFRVLIGVFGVALLAFVTIFLSRSQAGTADANPVHRARINERIATLKPESLEQSFDQLISDDQQYYWPGYHSESLGAELDLERMLSARRSTKVLQGLSKLPVAQRDRTCKQFFDKAFQMHTNAEHAVLRRVKDQSSPAPKVSADATRFALCAAMFATADFGRREMLSDQFAQLDRFRNEFVPLLGTNFFDNILRIRAFPDNRFLVNVLRLVAERDSRDGGKLLRQVVEECANANMKEKSISVVGWEAKTTWFETRWTGKMDTSKGVKTYITVDWAIADFGRQIKKEKVVEKLRSIVFH